MLAFVAVFALLCPTLFASEREIEFEKITSDSKGSDVKVESQPFEGTWRDARDEIKIERMTIESETFKSYESPEVKKERNFKYFNNTYMYVSFRETFVSKPG